MAVDAGDWCYHWPRCASFDDCQAAQVSGEGWTVVDTVVSERTTVVDGRRD